jgi:hypothetical protein
MPRFKIGVRKYLVRRDDDASQLRMIAGSQSQDQF